MLYNKTSFANSSFRLLALLGFSLSLLFATNVFAAHHSLEFNKKQSKAEFSFLHSSPASSKMHDIPGVFKALTATMSLDGKEITALEASVSVDDINTENNARDAHLQREDFFDVTTYPAIDLEFVSHDGDTLVADLTIKGITKRINFESHIASGRKVVTLHLNGTVHRLDYELGNEYKTSGRGAISDEVEVKLTLAFNRN